MGNISYKEEIRRKTSKPLLWIGIVSIIMFFGGLTSAVIVSQGGGEFLRIDMPFAFTISTLVIILSSIAFHFALISIKKENYVVAKASIIATLLLGLLFVATQYMGWVNLYENGVYAVGTQSTQESSFIYLLTALHIAHLLGGLVSLGMQVSITYWHFLGGLWIYLFFFLKFIIA